MAEKKRQKDGANYRQAYYAKFRLISRQKGTEQNRTQPEQKRERKCEM